MIEKRFTNKKFEANYNPWYIRPKPLLTYSRLGHINRQIHQYHLVNPIAYQHRRTFS